MDHPLPRRAAENPTQYNIEAIAKLEHDALERRTLTERLSDVMTKLVTIAGPQAGGFLGIRSCEVMPQLAGKSVPRNRRINLRAPRINPASHALAGGYTLLPQPVRHIQAADSVVAEDNQCRFAGLGFQLLQAGWNFPHGDQGGAVDARDGKFLRFANVNQYQRFPRVDSALDVLRAGFDWEDGFAHESEDSAGGNH
jgi:hypothetical protein